MLRGHYATECAACGRDTVVEDGSPRGLRGVCPPCWRRLGAEDAHEAALWEQARNEREPAAVRLGAYRALGFTDAEAAGLVCIPLPRRRQARYTERVRRLGWEQLTIGGTDTDGAP